MERKIIKKRARNFELQMVWFFVSYIRIYSNLVILLPYYNQQLHGVGIKTSPESRNSGVRMILNEEKKVMGEKKGVINNSLA